MKRRKILTSSSSSGSRLSKVQEAATHSNSTDASIEQIRSRARSRKTSSARELASQIRILPDGSRVFVRFNQAQRIEHQVLLVTFTLLAVTGLAQRYSELGSISFTINNLMGGIETVRTIHHLVAVLFIIEAAYHIWVVLFTWFVKKQRGSMWPEWRDVTDFVQMIKYNLNLSDMRPRFARFSFDEKIEYWALLWGTAVMILTGIAQWFPIQTTLLLPGEAVPVARSIHGWEAVLATLAILTWHLYHTIVKHRNLSIFTGTMTEEEMEEEHELEYRRILAADEYLEKRKAKKQETEKAADKPSDEKVAQLTRAR
jgi:cytochrome b subunit of formate dehydrogenase